MRTEFEHDVGLAENIPTTRVFIVDECQDLRHVAEKIEVSPAAGALGVAPHGREEVVAIIALHDGICLAET